MFYVGNVKHRALSEAWLHPPRKGQTGGPVSGSNTGQTACARGKPGARGVAGAGAEPPQRAPGLVLERPARRLPIGRQPAARDGRQPRAAAAGPEPGEPAESPPRAGPGRSGRPPPRRVPRSGVLSARAAGGLSVRERPGPIQWPLSAGPFVQEAATSCGAGLEQAGGNAPSRGPDAEAAPAWGQRRRPAPGAPWGWGSEPEEGAALGSLSSALSSECLPWAQRALRQWAPSWGATVGIPSSWGRAAEGGGRSSGGGCLSQPALRPWSLAEGDRLQEVGNSVSQDSSSGRWKPNPHCLAKQEKEPIRDSRPGRRSEGNRAPGASSPGSDLLALLPGTGRCCASHGSAVSSGRSPGLAVRHPLGSPGSTGRLVQHSDWQGLGHVLTPPGGVGGGRPPAARFSKPRLASRGTDLSPTHARGGPPVVRPQPALCPVP
ncbi:PREDICTED: uncharacterized protein LOC109381055 [Hipposideros armiger]|uniref:Uncharacterized protein LOC109381055 n=1 Tax=Hipposideros armiger TaxID=186990 RepID=A0A8B7R4W2_HIPAR|nr:PREDICTED: uncharacterized protein LOC109381055 [Hipposideros armiger]